MKAEGNLKNHTCRGSGGGGFLRFGLPRVAKAAIASMRFFAVVIGLLLPAICNAIAVGDRVQLSANTIVRVSPAGAQSSCTPNPQPAGAIGTVTNGPVTATYLGTSYQWVSVNWDANSCDGWSVVNWMNVLPQATAPGSFTLSSGAPYCDTAAPAGPAVQLTWTAASGVTTYRVYRNGTQIGSDYGSGQLSFLNNAGLVAGQSYTYKVTASNSSGSTDSNTITVTIPSGVCAAATAPGSFTLSQPTTSWNATTSSPEVQLSWTASSGVSTYDVYRNGSLYSPGVPNSTTTFSNTANLVAGQSYSYYIIARNASGTTQSNTVSIVAASAPAAQSFSLIVFPLPNRTHLNASINSVFDHSMDTTYCPDGRVVTYTGEEGLATYGSSLVGNITGCGDLSGFKNASATGFSVGGQYVGGGSPEFLFYDGHPGYDFRTIDQCPGGTVTSICPTGIRGQVLVLAAAAGTVKAFNQAFGRIEIDHGNGYETWYMHLSRFDVSLGQTVTAGEVIGLGGDVGATGSPHLHFEVRANGIPVDPYGWSGSGPDPYTRAVSVNLWIAQGAPVLSAPTLLSPLNGDALAVGTTSTTLQWSAVASAYNVEVFTGSCGGTSFNGLTTTQTTLTISGLTSGSTYYWRVQSIDGVSTSAYSNCFSFSVSGSTSVSVTQPKAQPKGFGITLLTHGWQFMINPVTWLNEMAKAIIASRTVDNVSPKGYTVVIKKNTNEAPPQTDELYDVGPSGGGR